MSAMTESKTYFPHQGESRVDLAALERYLSLQATVRSPRYALVGPEGEVELPPEVHEILVQVVSAMRSGHAITVSPNEAHLTTQQAADLLGVSRPTVVKAIEAGDLPAQRVSSRRKVALRDVLAYRERRRQAQLDAILASSGGLEDAATDDVATLLAAARKRVAQRRRERILRTDTADGR